MSVYLKLLSLYIHNPINYSLWFQYYAGQHDTGFCDIHQWWASFNSNFDDKQSFDSTPIPHNSRFRLNILEVDSTCKSSASSDIDWNSRIGIVPYLIYKRRRGFLLWSLHWCNNCIILYQILMSHWFLP